MNREAHEFFAKIEFLAALAPQVQAQVQPLFTRRRYPADTLLIREGVPDSHFGVVAAGEVAVEKSDGGEPFQLGVLSAGECYGEMGILDDAVPFASVRALTDVAVYEIDGRALRTLVDRDAAIALAFYRAAFSTMCQRLRSTSVLSMLNEGLFALMRANNERLEGLLEEMEAKRRELEQANLHLQDLRHKQQEFLGLVTHDLRNPLSIVENYAALLLEDVPAETRALVEPYAAPIRRQVEQMLALVNELLDLAKIEAGELKLQLAPISLIPLLREAQGHWRLVAAKKRLALHLKADESLPDVTADARKVAEVLDNLLSNAIKFTREGGEIHVTAEPSHATAEVLVTVKDTGLGIKKEELERLFEKYPRITTAATGGEKQHGLGLAIVRKIVGFHQGRVWAESDVGRGSEFTFTLPIARQAERRQEG